MKHIIDQTLILIFKEILAKEKSKDEWAEIESDDLIQEEPYVGGYDADEEAFCFSYFTEEEEFWFQVTFPEISEVVSGRMKEVNLVKANL